MAAQNDLKTLLKLADIAWTSNRIEDPAALVERRENAVAELRRHLRDLKRRPNAPGLLGELMRKHRFTQKEGLILLMLLKRRVSSNDPFLTGQRILKRLNGGSYEIMRDIHLLQPDGRLRSTQVVVPRDEHSDPEDLLGAEFTMSAWAFRALVSTVEAKRAAPKATPIKAYRRSEDVLLDYLKLVTLLQKRANSLFEIEEWEEVAPPGEVPARHIQAQIDQHTGHMRECMERTENKSAFAPIAFVEKYGLAETETQLVMALLFQELFQGEALAPVVELLKLVSRSKREYLRNLGLFDTNRLLVQKEIIAVEHPDEGRLFSGEACLAPWVVPAIIKGTKRGGGVSVDTWQRFRRYLSELRDSDTFFRDLDRPQ